MKASCAAALLLCCGASCAAALRAPRASVVSRPAIRPVSRPAIRRHRQSAMVAFDPLDADGGSGNPALGATEAERLRALLEASDARVAELEEQMARTEGLCEVLDDGGGWSSSLQTRASWLLGLLVCQSCSSFILADNEALLQSHPTVIFFMTMLVGAGGNAGNQAAVRIIRGLATGEVDPSDRERTLGFVAMEAKLALALGAILVCAGFVRVVAFQAATVDALAISASLFIIVSSSVVLGTLLPLLLNAIKVDAAHASTTIQVIMDVMGVLITCTVAPLVFNYALGVPGLG